MDLDLNYFNKKFDEINFCELKHYNRKGILSDYWLGYLESYIHFADDGLPLDKKKTIAKDMLFNALRRKTSFDPFQELITFYNQNSRDNLNEITKFKELFPELLNIALLLEQGLKDIITKYYYLIREKIESKTKSWTLYHVFIDPEFKKILKLIEEKS
ncbi:MAG: hypothetical protein HeimC3_26110 [Candidatus Heimdallarchaeota archaeon LC_3]|nr:MAG: hypothetical protein HeimC3_26110 [Candidatus Heimdallarchaeota archaeon LC_3]